MNTSLVTLVMLGAALLGCSGKDADTTQAEPVASAVDSTPTAALAQPSALAAEDAAAEMRRTIVAWLECEECEDGERDAVTKLGQKIVPSLAATLRQGPSVASRERLRLHLKETYGEMSKHSGAAGGTSLEYSETDFVNTYLANYEALYRVRSAQALAAIGGDEARKALELANSGHLRPDVKRALELALASMSSP